MLFDGGIGRGNHVVKALALGARAVLIGRAYAYGLAAAGTDGVRAALAILAREIDITLALMGIVGVTELQARGREMITDDR